MPSGKSYMLFGMQYPAKTSESYKFYFTFESEQEVIFELTKQSS